MFQVTKISSIWSCSIWRDPNFLIGTFHLKSFRDQKYSIQNSEKFIVTSDYMMSWSSCEARSYKFEIWETRHMHISRENHLICVVQWCFTRGLLPRGQDWKVFLLCPSRIYHFWEMIFGGVICYTPSLETGFLWRLVTGSTSEHSLLEVVRKATPRNKNALCSNGCFFFVPYIFLFLWGYQQILNS